MIIRAKTFRAWMLANQSPSELRDIAEHGVDCGWYGLTYTCDVIKLYDRFEEELWEMLCEDADSFGMSPLALVDSFKCGKPEHPHTFKNNIVWYAAERIAREIQDEREAA